MSMFKNRSVILFIILAGFFVTNALVAEMIGIKIFSLEQSLGFEPLDLSFFGVTGLSLNLTAGVLLWPVVFVMTDVINEYYGKRGVKFLSYLAVGLISYAFVMIFVAIELTPNSWWNEKSGLLDSDVSMQIESMNVAFHKVFGQGLWIIIGSLVAFLVGQLLDVTVYLHIRKRTGEGLIWLRATGSTLLSQLVDSYLVLIIAFYIGADWELNNVIAIGTMNYLYKFVVAVLLTPLIYVSHNLIDRYLGANVANEMKKRASLQS